MVVGVNQGFNFREGGREVGDLIVTAIDPTLGRISLEFENAVTFREISLQRGESFRLDDAETITVQLRDIRPGIKLWEPEIGADLFFYTNPRTYRWRICEYE